MDEKNTEIHVSESDEVTEDSTVSEPILTRTDTTYTTYSEKTSYTVEDSDSDYDSQFRCPCDHCHAVTKFFGL